MGISASKVVVEEEDEDDEEGVEDAGAEGGVDEIEVEDDEGGVVVVVVVEDDEVDGSLAAGSGLAGTDSVGLSTGALDSPPSLGSSMVGTAVDLLTLAPLSSSS